MTQVELTCENPSCQKRFLRNASEAKRNARFNRKVFCCRSCGVIYDNLFLPNPGNPANLKPGKLSDDLSPFRPHLRNIRMHCKQRKATREVTITLEDLRSQWLKQKGTCPYTGWVLENYVSCSYDSNLLKTPRRASIDRIDSSKGYTPDNIQFVCLAYNYCKNGWTHDEVFAFCEQLIQHSSVKNHC